MRNYKHKLIVVAIISMIILVGVCITSYAEDTSYQYVDAKLSRNYYTIIEDFTPPDVIVTNSQEELLVRDVDYTVEYEQDYNSQGTHTVEIKGLSPYNFSKTLYYTVLQHDGVCGDNVYYYKDEINGNVMYIFGTGDIWDVNDSTYCHPNYAYLASGRPFLKGITKIIIDSGVTKIGAKSFAYSYDLCNTDFYPDLETVIIPESVELIENDAFTHGFEDIYINNPSTVIATNTSIITKRLHGIKNSTAYNYAKYRDNIEFVEECAFHLLSKHNFKKASMDEDGNYDYYQCVTCNNCYADELGQTAITADEYTIPRIESVTLDTTEFKYDGSAKIPTATVTTVNRDILTAGIDYYISCVDNIETGTAVANVIFIGNYQGKTTQQFTISSDITLSGNVVGCDSFVIKLIKDNAIIGTSEDQVYKFDNLSNSDYTISIDGNGEYVSRSYDITVNGTMQKDLQLCKRGDVDMNNVRNASDVTRLARVVAKIQNETDDYALKLQDTNLSGEVNAADITNLARLVAKIIDNLEIDEGVGVKVPSLTGLSEDAARQALVSVGLMVGNITYSPSEKDKGTVIWQQYQAGNFIEKGTTVDFEVSKGKETTP